MWRVEEVGELRVIVCVVVGCVWAREGGLRIAFFFVGGEE